MRRKTTGLVALMKNPGLILEAKVRNFPSTLVAIRKTPDRKMTYITKKNLFLVLNTVAPILVLALKPSGFQVLHQLQLYTE